MTAGGSEGPALKPHQSQDNLGVGSIPSDPPCHGCGHRYYNKDRAGQVPPATLPVRPALPINPRLWPTPRRAHYSVKLPACLASGRWQQQSAAPLVPGS